MGGRVIWWVLVLFVAASASAQPTGGDAASETHGWFGVPSLGGDGGTLLHLPPRTVGGTVGAEAGTARPARVLEFTPSAVAGWGARTYLFFAGAGERRVEVYSIRVSLVGVSGAWVTEPPEGATAEPVLMLDGAAFVGAVGWRGGAAALGRGDGWRLWVLRGGEWREAELPGGLGDAESAWLVEGEAQPTVLSLGDGSVRRWVLGGADLTQWNALPLKGAAIGNPRAVVGAFVSAGDVCLIERDGEAVRVRALGPNLTGEIARVDLNGQLVGTTPLAGGRRLGLLTVVRDADASGPSRPISTWELVEVSLVSGREMYRGPLRHPALAIGDEVRLLSLLMMGMTVCILFYLLRPSGAEGETRLPEGFALATPGRRFLAAAIDLLLMAGLVRLVLGVPVADLVLVAPLFDSAQGLLALTALVVGGVVYSTAAEWLTGRTIGKLLVGVRVVSVDPARPRVGLMRTGGRNVFRWVLAPWAVFGMGSQDFRHRGDVFAGSAVVVRRREGAGEG